MPLKEFFHRRRNSEARTENSTLAAIGDALASRLSDLTLEHGAKPTTSPPSDHRPHPKTSSSHFIGGFNHSAQHDPYGGGGRPEYFTSSPAVTGQTPIVFPQPARYDNPSPPGPLPKPPAMAMPVPQSGKYSLTMQHALSSPLQSTPLYPQLEPDSSLRPPFQQIPPRPHSNPITPQTPINSSYPPATPPRSTGSSSAQPTPTSTKDFDPFLPVSSPATPTGRKSRTSSTPASPSSSSTSDDTVQCSGYTKAGNRCKRMVKLKPALVQQNPDADSEIERYCSQHTKEVLAPTGFMAKGDQFVTYTDWIPGHLQQDTQIALRVEMEKPPSKADENGYIYTFQILDDKKDVILLKVGRTNKLNQRINQWSKQCGSKEQILRGFWPGTVDEDQPSLMKGRVNPGETGKFSHRLERLVHLELADLALNTPYLDSSFPDIDNFDPTTPRKNSGVKTRKACPDCGAMHKEIFEFKRPKKGRYEGKEWELIVKPVIEKWGTFVESYL